MTFLVCTNLLLGLIIYLAVWCGENREQFKSSSVIDFMLVTKCLFFGGKFGIELYDHHSFSLFVTHRLLISSLVLQYSVDYISSFHLYNHGSCQAVSCCFLILISFVIFCVFLFVSDEEGKLFLC